MENILLNYGPLGVMVIAMAAVIVKQYYDGKEKDTYIRALQDQRIEDAKQTRDAIVKPMQDLGNAIANVGDSVSKVGDMVDKVYESVLSGKQGK